MPRALTVARVDDHWDVGQSRGDAAVDVRIGVVSVDDIEPPGVKQADHLPHLSETSRWSERVDPAARIADDVGEPAHVCQREELGPAVCGIVVPRDVGQQPFQSARLQGQADMAHAQRTTLRGGVFVGNRTQFGNRHDATFSFNRLRQDRMFERRRTEAS